MVRFYLLVSPASNIKCKYGFHSDVINQHIETIDGKNVMVGYCEHCGKPLKKEEFGIIFEEFDEK